MEYAHSVPHSPADDLNHLRWLSIAHYIYAGFIALSSLFALLFFAVGYFVGDVPPRPGEPSPEAMRFLFVGIGVVVLIFGLGIAAAVFFAGRSLAQHRRHTYCIVMAGIECLSVPLGTLLGVFTIVVLMRPAVKALFEPPSTLPPPENAI